MASQIVAIGPFQLALSLIFILAAGFFSLIYSLGLSRDLALGTLRTFVQLFILGYFLKFIFAIDSLLLMSGVFCFMIFFAAWTVYNRVRRTEITFFWPVCASMFFSFSIVLFIVTALIVQVKPWWTPQYFIPLAGMVIGNSMHAVALAIERFFQELDIRRSEIEMRLSMGGSPSESSRHVFRTAVRAGMIPSINSMMTAGVVFIPGMMTGQILGGANPLTAIKYQIVVMLMITGATAIGVVVTLILVRRKSFGNAGQLTLRRT